MTGASVISLVLFVWCMGVDFDEAVGYDYSPAKKEEYEVEIQKVEVYEIPWIGDQQPQNGYEPPKQQYGPPPQKYNSPSEAYGTPAQEYGPPPQEYGPPEFTTTEYPDLTTTESANTTNITLSNNSTQKQTAKLKEISGDTNTGQYYIYHPSGLLQRVIYLTADDSKNMAFSARLKYKNVDPIRGPIYTYDPDTYVFSRLNRK